MKEQLKRSEVDVKTTWDLTRLFKTESDFEKALEEAIEMTMKFIAKHKGNIKGAVAIREALVDYKDIIQAFQRLSTYVSLHSSSDQTNEASVVRAGMYANKYGEVIKELSFLDPEIKENATEEIEKAIEMDGDLFVFLDYLIRSKPHSLSSEVEGVLAAFSQVFDAPRTIYFRSKLADMDFGVFTVGDKTYPNSFTLFESELEYEVDYEIRREAFKSFYNTLTKYQNTFAEVYKTFLLKQKAESDLRGFDSIFDYLLFDQKVTREMYDRQVDLIMTHLAPHMRKYVRLLKKIYGITDFKFADLKLVVDPDFEPTITIEESRKYLLEGLSILGEDYQEILNRAYDERWIDFPQNIGKSTGAFCTSPYGVNPFVLISWTKKMREVFVLAHELGHAGHSCLTQANQSIYNDDLSLYFVEAPSTMNEIIVANHMVKEADDARMKRWVYASMISRTYYHNFVTHFLEAHYQREVYKLIDAGEPISASVLKKIMRASMEEFWGDEVIIEENVDLTWMRQPHYYSGLYPYTYSAGLTVATCASQKVLNNEISIDAWKDVLKAGGTKTPMELAAMVNVDLSTEKPLLDTIAYIGGLIDSIIELTTEIES